MSAQPQRRELAPLSAVMAAFFAGLRAEAAHFRAYGAEPQAATLEQVANEGEAVLRNASEELLTLEQAARVSGFSADHLGRLVRTGTLRNLGRTRAPRVRRGDLPTKRTPAAPHLSAHGSADASLSALGRELVVAKLSPERRGA